MSMSIGVLIKACRFMWGKVRKGARTLLRAVISTIRRYEESYEGWGLALKFEEFLQDWMRKWRLRWNARKFRIGVTAI